jgi:hypothetical protein
MLSRYYPDESEGRAPDKIAAPQRAAEAKRKEASDQRRRTAMLLLNGLNTLLSSRPVFLLARHVPNLRSSRTRCYHLNLLFESKNRSDATG